MPYYDSRCYSVTFNKCRKLFDIKLADLQGEFWDDRRDIMITGIEIRNQQFKKSLRGYNQEDVKQYLSNIAQDHEKLYSENAELKEKLQRLEYDLVKYRRMEESMNNTLILAQQTAEELKSTSRREAAVMLEEAKKKITDMMIIYQEVIKRLNLFNAELRGQISAHLELLDKNFAKVDEMSKFFYNTDIKDAMEQLEKIKAEDL